MMINGHQIAIAAGCCLIGLSPLGLTLAEQHEEESGERCVSLSRIDRTEVIDDHNILFHMRGGEIYRNQLPRRCPGLRRERSFSYRTSLAQLCDLDTITVLHDYGTGITSGASCGLGRFIPITEEEIQILKDAPRHIEPEEVPTADPEELGEPDTAE